MIDIESIIIDGLKELAQKDDVLKEYFVFANSNDPDLDVYNSIRPAYVATDLYPSIEVLEMESRYENGNYSREEVITSGEIQIQVVCNISFKVDEQILSIRNSCIYMQDFVREFVENTLHLQRLSLVKPIANGTLFIGSMRYRYKYNKLTNKII